MFKLKKLIVVLVSIYLFSMSSIVFAAAHGHAKVGSGPNPYRDCGIGAAIFPNHHIAAATSNVIWDLGSTAVTSATMSPETCSNVHAKTAKFIIDNYENLIEDVAKGEGEHLVAVLDIEGCSSSRQADVVTMIRSNMGSKVASTEYSQKARIDKAADYYHAVTSASSSCSV
ncbi:MULTISPECIES: DUF3015 family protein [Cycloclasticus]|uniref:DUF3015 domain-containing protein n=1 Tax=Cycloclasticus pugetii TaxID=34068 RepID=A0AB33Z3L5_9GAMM|nr:MULTISPECIES: DUF3015 family protein [Cycloclasticus]ATI03456.1 DUF3015 domain-containing protein [Cycloclasticus sp. PY97N]EPD13935.1 hypothetical protein L196_00510 [Cycloclasticus pugetii]